MLTKFIRKNPSTAIMISVPHAGQNYPDEFLLYKNIDLKKLRIMEDFQCDKILDKVKSNVADIIIQKCSRAVVDLNRSRNAIDEKMFNDKILIKPPEDTLMLRSGLGVIPKKCYQNFIFKSKLPKSYAIKLLKTVYDPYHQILNNNLQNLKSLFGYYLLIDLHSMPSKLLNNNQKTVDIIIGNNYGKSCSNEIKDFFYNFFKSRSLNVLMNDPFSGGYITRNYGDKNNNLHTVQIEINKRLYMDEKNYFLKDNLKNLQIIFSELLTNFSLIKKIAAE